MGNPIPRDAPAMPSASPVDGLTSNHGGSSSSNNSGESSGQSASTQSATAPAPTTDPPRSLIIAIASTAAPVAEHGPSSTATTDNPEGERAAHLERGLQALSILLNRVRDRQVGLSRTLQEVRSSMNRDQSAVAAPVGPTWLDDTAATERTTISNAQSTPFTLPESSDRTETSTTIAGDVFAAIIVPNPLSRQSPATRSSSSSSRSNTTGLSRTAEDSQGFLRSTEQALRSATAFAQRLEDVTRSLSGMATRNRLRANQGSSGGSSTESDPGDVRSALARSIEDLRSASARIDRVFEELEMSRRAANEAIGSAEEALSHVSSAGPRSPLPRSASRSATTTTTSSISQNATAPERRPWRRAPTNADSSRPYSRLAEGSQAAGAPLGRSNAVRGHVNAVTPPMSASAQGNSSFSARTGRLHVKLDKNGDPELSTDDEEGFASRRPVCGR